MREGIKALMLSIIVAVLMTWPWAINPRRVLGARHLEAADHLWVLWLARWSNPLVIDTELVDPPTGYEWVVGDPIHVFIFGLGEVFGGVSVGLALVHISSCLLAAAAGWGWARTLWPEVRSCAVVAAPLAAAAPGLSVGVVTGMTEAQPLGATALALLALHRLLEQGGNKRAVATALMFGALPWFGAYPALYAILLAPIPLVMSAWRGHLTRQRVFLVGLASIAALLLASPVAHAILSTRSDTLPGATSITQQVLADPTLSKNRLLGADVWSLLLPSSARGPTDAYLGLGLLIASLLSARSRGPTGVLWVSALVASVLAMGTFIQVGGHVITLGESILLAPAGVLSLLLEPLGRAPRWTRMATLASILLAPLAARGMVWLAARYRRPALVLLPMLTAVLADSLLLGPAPFPRPTFNAAMPDEFNALAAEPGAILELPEARFSTTLTEVGGGPQAGLRHPTLVWQTQHGLALSGNPHQATDAHSTTRLSDQLSRALESRESSDIRRLLTTARAQGFVWAVSWRGVATPTQRASYAAALGPPDVEGTTLVAWRLTD